MKNKLFKLGTLLLALLGIAENKIYASEKSNMQKSQYISKVNDTTPLYLDEAMPASEDNNGIIIAWHSSHSSHRSHSSHYSSRF
ncbi:MAG: hypothetical protein K940chlam1_01141 [Candidatus Anoxychlamydiales bacterium]|nr:hypothetical protein [Candidatus Anoxychlamydiales bacterium]NGX36817.1 hypothetical protein [Candidatus Anoxychlamydiales bacterium]